MSVKDLISEYERCHQHLAEAIAGDDWQATLELDQKLTSLHDQIVEHKVDGPKEIELLTDFLISLVCPIQERSVVSQQICNRLKELVLHQH